MPLFGERGLISGVGQITMTKWSKNLQSQTHTHTKTVWTIKKFPWRYQEGERIPNNGARRPSKQTKSEPSKQHRKNVQRLVLILYVNRRKTISKKIRQEHTKTHTYILPRSQTLFHSQRAELLLELAGRLPPPSSSILTRAQLCLCLAAIAEGRNRSSWDRATNQRHQSPRTSLATPWGDRGKDHTYRLHLRSYIYQKRRWSLS